MPAHYRLLAAVLAAIAFFGAGSYLGYQYADGRHAEAAARAQEQAIEGARQQFEADRQQAVDRARREAVAEERARSAKSRGVSDASLKAKPGCVRDTESLSLLHDAIRAANSETDPGSLPESVSGSAGTGRR